MNPPSPLISNQAAPCPKCDYDLRGQSSARCPECGTTFESIEAMLEAAESANRILTRVSKWCRPLNYFSLAALLASIVIIRSGDSIGVSSQIAIPILLSWPIAGMLALGLLIQVIRWRRDPLISRCQRAELNESIIWLIVLCIPLPIVVLALYVWFL